MTGQDAVNSAKAFNEALELDGVILTKLDGDARGGAALSVKQVTGVPIKFIGTGEHLDALEEFHPDRMAGRILGQGDLLTLVEKAQQEFDQDEMLRAGRAAPQGRVHARRLPQAALADRQAGPAAKSDGPDPRHGRASTEMMGDVDPEQDMKRLFGIIDSMTPEERRNPTKMIDQSRRRRIAAGAGVEPHEVNELVKQFDAMAQMMTDGRQRHARADEDGQRAAKRHDAKPERPGHAKRSAPASGSRPRSGPSSRKSAKRKCAAASASKRGQTARGEAESARLLDDVLIHRTVVAADRRSTAVLL